MPKITCRVLLHFCFILPAYSATSYTIQPLIDTSKPEIPFFFNGAAFGTSPVNNTPYFAGVVSPNPAIGTLTDGNFTVLSLSPLPGGDFATVSSTLKDGSAVGITNTFIPNPVDPNFPPLQTARITRWVNGVASEIVITDPNDPNALFPPSPIAFNSEGAIVGQHISNGVLSAFRYNVFDESFAVIPLPFSDVFQLIVSGVNEQGKILAIANGPITRQILFDPVTNSWEEIPLPAGKGIGGLQTLNSIGQFATVYLDFATFSTVPYYFDGTNLLPLYTGSDPLPGPVNSIYGFNRHGQALGNFATRLGVFSGGAFDELFPRIINSDGWATFNTFIDALVGINDNGQIFGIGRFNNQPTSFVLNPIGGPEVPEPNTILLTLSVLALLPARKAFGFWK